MRRWPLHESCEIRFYINLCFKMATWNHWTKGPIFIYVCLWLFLWLDTTADENFVNPLSANPTKWPNTLKQFVGNLPIPSQTNYILCCIYWMNFKKVLQEWSLIKYRARNNVRIKWHINWSYTFWNTSILYIKWRFRNNLRNASFLRKNNSASTSTH